MVASALVAAAAALAVLSFTALAYVREVGRPVGSWALGASGSAGTLRVSKGLRTVAEFVAAVPAKQRSIEGCWESGTGPQRPEVTPTVGMTCGQYIAATSAAPYAREQNGKCAEALLPPAAELAAVKGVALVAIPSGKTPEEACTDASKMADRETLSAAYYGAAWQPSSELGPIATKETSKDKLTTLLTDDSGEPLGPLLRQNQPATLAACLDPTADGKCADKAAAATWYSTNEALPSLRVARGASAIASKAVEATGAIRGNWYAAKSDRISGWDEMGALTACELATKDADKLDPLKLDATYAQSLLDMVQIKC